MGMGCIQPLQGETLQAALWVFMSALSSSPGTQGLVLRTGLKSPKQITSVNVHR